MQPLAVDLLKSSLVGLDVLFGRTEIGFWQGQVRLVLERDDPEAMAAAYRSISHGSAPGTFYDLLITERNGHQIVENQEPWANEILTTLQVLAAAAVEAITASGAAANCPWHRRSPLASTHGARPPRARCQIAPGFMSTRSSAPPAAPASC